MTSKYDDWLTNQPEGSPIHHDYETISDYIHDLFLSTDEDGNSDLDSSPYSLSYENMDGLNCYSCKEVVGWTLDDTDETRVNGSFSPFWQMDDDGEILLCEPCFDYYENDVEDSDEE